MEPQGKIKYHKNLAEYFCIKSIYLDEGYQLKPNTRKLVEQPWQQTRSELWDELTNTLSYLSFIQAKVTAGLLFDVISDYDLAITQIQNNNSNSKNKNTEREEILQSYSTAFNQEYYAFQDFSKITAQQIFNNLFSHFGFNGDVGSLLKKFINSENLKLWFRQLNTNPDTGTSKELYRTVTGHEYSIICLAISENNQYIASGDSGGIIGIWQMKDGKPIHRFQAHVGGVINLQWISDENLVSFGRDHVVKIWNWREQAEINSFYIQSDRIRNFQLFADNDQFVFCGENRKITKGNFQGTHQNSIGEHSGRVFCLLLINRDNLLISGSEDRTIKIWNVSENNADLMTLRGHNDSLLSLAFSEKDHMIISGSKDKTIKQWNLKNGMEIRTLAGHQAQVNSLKVAEQSSAIFSCSDDTTIKMWDIHSGLQLNSFNGHKKAVNTIQISNEEKWCVSGSEDCTLRFWRINPSFKKHHELFEHRGRINYICRDRDVSLVATASDDNFIKIWNIPDGEYKMTLRGHIGPVRCLLFLNKSIVSGGDDTTIKIWDAGKGNLIKSIGDFSKSVVTSSVKVSGFNSYSYRNQDGFHEKQITCLSAYDNNQFFSGSKDGTVRLWNLDSAELCMIYKGLNGTVESVVYNPNNGSVIGAGSSNEILIWDVHSGTIKMRLSGHLSSITSLVLHGNNHLLSSGLDKTVQIWDLETGYSISTDEHPSRITCVETDINSGLFFTGSIDRQIRVFSISNGTQVQILTGHNSPVRSLLFENENSQVISCADSGEIIIWDTKEPGNAKIISKVYLQDSVSCIKLLQHDLICTSLTNGGLSFLNKNF